MSESFDPYYKWLGIKPKDQPPNHYRLLGVEMFESDVDVIENAADQRMRHMRSLQSGANAEASQRILNEVATARVCLTDPVKRAAYDRLLQSAQAVAQAVPPPQAAPPPAPPVGTAVAPPVAVAQRPKTVDRRSGAAAQTFSPTATVPRHRTASRRKNGFPMAMAVSVGGFLVIAVLAMVLLSVLKSKPTSAFRPAPDQVDRRLPSPSPPVETKTTSVGPTIRPSPSTTGSKPPPDRPLPTGDLKLVEIPTVTLAPGASLRVQATLHDPERWKDKVQFAAGLGVPPETKVDAKTGWIEWSPPKGARHTYLFNIEARAGADEAATSFQVDLPWARGDLIFDSPGDRTANPGEPLVVHLSARDDVGQVEGARFELLAGPAGAVIDPGSSQFRWQAGEEQLDTKQPVSVKVTDARGVSARTSFTIKVEKKPPPTDTDAAGNNNEPGRPDFADRFRRRNALRFDGTGYVTTSWHYDGSTPLTLEVIATPYELRRCAVLGCMHLSGVGITMTGEGKWAFVVQDKERSVQIVSDEPAKVNHSDHVAGVFAEGRMGLFVDGKLQRETASVGQFVPSRHALLIGADTNGEGQPEAFFRGSIRIVRASNTARYRESFQRPYRLSSGDGTTLMLEFNQGAGDEVRDQSGKHPPAKIHGAVWSTR